MGLMQYGEFTRDGEYKILTYRLPRPWRNYLGNEEYGVVLSHTGGGYSVSEPPGRVRVTRYDRDDRPGRYLYVRDNDLNTFWSAGYEPVRAELQDYFCLHGMGYTIISGEKNGVLVRMRIFVPLEGPVEVWTVEVQNRSGAFRDVSLFPYVEWYLAGNLHPADLPIWYLQAGYNAAEGGIVAHLDDPGQCPQHYTGFMAGSREPDGYDCSRRMFLGPDLDLASPWVVRQGTCRYSSANMEDAIGCLCYRLRLQPDAMERIDVVVGVSNSAEERRQLRARLFAPGAVDHEFERVKAFWKDFGSRVSFATPDADVNAVCNQWLKYQIAQCGLWVRGGDKGFRDVMQDAMGILPFAPDLARKRFLDALQYQYANGFALRQWSINGGSHDTRPYQDSPVWIAFTLTKYVRETGDLAILEEPVAFLGSRETGTVREHVNRAMDYLYTERGTHGLCLIRGGDWNDALNGVGRAGRGESVWLTMALAYALTELASLFDYAGDREQAVECRERAASLRAGINDSAWDGDWYLRAYSDDGKPVGSHRNAKGRIYLNAQSWAVICGAASAGRALTCMRAADKWLSTPFGPIMLAPAYDGYEDGVGRISVLRPGEFENGGIYVHAAVFKMLADCMLGRGNEAYKTLMAVSPFNPENPPSHSTCEPYVYPNCYFGPESGQDYGVARYSWLTATADWLFYVLTEWMIGVRPDYDGLVIAPCLPSVWHEVHLRRRFRGATYDVTILNPDGVETGIKSLSLDGDHLIARTGTEGSGGRFPAEMRLPVLADGRRHQVVVIMGS